MKNIFKIIIKSLLGIILFLLFLPFLISPIYNFEEPKAFSGNKLWNPYQNMEEPNWLKGNFQIQSEAWGGITDGSNNPTDSIYALYKKLNYDIIGISDYMKINTYFKDSAEYMPIYEHGYNSRKTHQVSIGAKKIFWLDFPFYQTTSHKQFIINQLRENTEVLSIVHPAFHLEGYSHEDLSYLTNYDLLEALNHQKFSLSHWDATLSAGHAKYILANDDAHDIENPFLVGVVATMIDAKSNMQEDVIEALLAGRNYGYIPKTPDSEDYDKKAERAKDFPYLVSAKLDGNNYEVKFTKRANKIRFIGQNGELKKEVEKATSANYQFTNDDTYIRVETYFSSADNRIYMNPVFRYSGDNPLAEVLPSISWWKSISMWIISWVLFIFVMIKLKRLWSRKLN